MSEEVNEADVTEDDEETLAKGGQLLCSNGQANATAYVTAQLKDSPARPTVEMDRVQVTDPRDRVTMPSSRPAAPGPLGPPGPPIDPTHRLPAGARAPHVNGAAVQPVSTPPPPSARAVPPPFPSTPAPPLVTAPQPTAPLPPVTAPPRTAPTSDAPTLLKGAPLVQVPAAPALPSPAGTRNPAGGSPNRVAVIAGGVAAVLIAGVALRATLSSRHAPPSAPAVAVTQATPPAPAPQAPPAPEPAAAVPPAAAAPAAVATVSPSPPPAAPDPAPSTPPVPDTPATAATPPSPLPAPPSRAAEPVKTVARVSSPPPPSTAATRPAPPPPPPVAAKPTSHRVFGSED